MTNQRKSPTRNQKRERIKTAVLVAATLILWAVLAAMTLEVWAAHPGEQAISGTEWREDSRNGMEDYIE